MGPVTILVPVLYTLLLWWLTTGMIMAVYDRSQVVTRLFFAGLSAAALLAFAGLFLTRSLTRPVDVYIAVTCGIVIWGWHVASYYLGFITGPRQKAPLRSANDAFAARFRRAFSFGMYHEILALITCLVIAAMTWPYANRWGLWIYLVMWLMHASAKLNVFLGVRNFSVELLPQQMRYLSSVLGKQSSNVLFPVSVVVASSVIVIFVYQGIAPAATPAQTTGSFLIATMVALGLLEHWMLMLPLPAALWGWGFRTVPDTVDTHETSTQVVTGSGD